MKAITLLPESRSDFNSFAIFIAVVGPAKLVDEKSTITAGISSSWPAALINWIRSLVWICSVEDPVAISSRKSELNTSWSTTVPTGSMNSTLPLGSLTSDSIDVIGPKINIIKKIKTMAVAILSIMILAFSRKLLSQEKIDLIWFIIFQ